MKNDEASFMGGREIIPEGAISRRLSVRMFNYATIRPLGALLRVIRQFEDTEIYFEHGTGQVLQMQKPSAMDFLVMEFPQDSVWICHARGPRAAEALDALEKLVADPCWGNPRPLGG